MNKILTTTIALAAVAGVTAGCGGHGSSAAPTATTPAPVTSTTPSSSLGPVARTTTTPPRTAVTAKDVADPLLPSKLGSGRLDKKSVKQLAQFFEDKVSAAYADGKPDALYHYLAGPMLTGNRGTINLLNGQNKRNVYKIKVGSIALQTNQADHVVFTMNADMTVNYFFNPTTRKILDNGLPGPSQVKFVIFLDQNPKTHTWYWTGEENNSSGTGNGVTTGSSVTNSGGTLENPQ